MKYYIMPFLVTVIGGIFAVSMTLIGLVEKERWGILVVPLFAALGLSIFAILITIAESLRNDHIIRNLKKHGLWQDEIIKNKDLPK